MPDFTFLLADLAAQSDEELRRWAVGACPMLVLWAFKHARHEPDMVAALRSVRDLCFAVLQAPDGKRAVASSLAEVFADEP